MIIYAAIGHLMCPSTTTGLVGIHSREENGTRQPRASALSKYCAVRRVK